MDLSASAARVDEIVEKGTISDAAINASSGTAEYTLGPIPATTTNYNNINYNLFRNLECS